MSRETLETGHCVRAEQKPCLQTFDQPVGKERTTRDFGKSPPSIATKNLSTTVFSSDPLVWGFEVERRRRLKPPQRESPSLRTTDGTRETPPSVSHTPATRVQISTLSPKSPLLPSLSTVSKRT